MNHTRSFFLIVASLSTILISSFAAPAQSRKNGAAKLPAAVLEIDPKALQGLLKREMARPLLVNFWATWCDPCREEFPELVTIDKQYREKGLDFIAVSLDDLADIKTAVPEFLREMRATMPAYLLNAGDPDLALSAVDPEWRGALPATFLYDSQGKIAYKRFGRIKPLELRAAIDKLVGSKQ